MESEVPSYLKFCNDRFVLALSFRDNTKNRGAWDILIFI